MKSYWSWFASYRAFGEDLWQKYGLARLIIQIIHVLEVYPVMHCWFEG